PHLFYTVLLPSSFPFFSSFSCYTLSFPLFPYTTLFRSLLFCSQMTPRLLFYIHFRIIFNHVTNPFLNHIITHILSAVFARCEVRSEEHTSEVQSRFDLLSRLMLEITKLN